MQMTEEIITEVETENNEETLNPEGQNKKVSWARFVETEVVNFFTGYKLEKMTLEDGNGSKAKLSRTRDGGIKIEYTSTLTI